MPRLAPPVLSCLCARPVTAREEGFMSTQPHRIDVHHHLFPEGYLFGSDLPFLLEPMVAKGIHELGQYRGLGAPVHAAIERDNALALFPCLRRMLSSVVPAPAPSLRAASRS